GHRHEARLGAVLEALWISPSVDREHGVDRRHHCALRHGGSGDAHRAHRPLGPRAGIFQLAAVHEPQFDGVCRYLAGRFEHVELDCQHLAANLDELRPCLWVAPYRLVLGRHTADGSRGGDARVALRIPDAGRAYDRVVAVLLDAATGG